MEVMQEIYRELAKQVGEAYDKGCFVMLDKIIELAEINRGYISVQQLQDFKAFAEKKIAEMNAEIKI